MQYQNNKCASKYAYTDKQKKLKPMRGEVGDYIYLHILSIPRPETTSTLSPSTVYGKGAMEKVPEGLFFDQLKSKE